MLEPKVMAQSRIKIIKTESLPRWSKLKIWTNNLSFRIYDHSWLPNAERTHVLLCLHIKIHWNKWLYTDMLKLSNLTKQVPTYLTRDNFHQRTHTRPMCKTIMKSNQPSHEERFYWIKQSYS